MILCAPYIFPVDSPPLLDGAIVVEQDRILALGPRETINSEYSSHKISEFPEHILMPGLVNCHTHLELSFLAGKIQSGLAFVDWLRALIKLRFSWQNLFRLRWQEKIDVSVRQGIEHLIASGTTCVADISNSNSSQKLLEDAGLRGIVFLEAIGFQAGQAQSIVDQLEVKLKDGSKCSSLVKLGLAPHAPYSVSPALFQQIRQLAEAYDICKLSVHLAESREELQFLADGSGPFRELLEWRQSREKNWQPPECSPVQYLNRLQVLTPDLLAVHANYLCPEDYLLLAQQQVQVVTCPASNAWLGRKNSHLRALCEHGVNLALGTDSLASNDDLNLFKEMRVLARDNTWLEFDELIRIATLGGARALGFEDKIGSITPGKQADIIAVAASPNLEENKLAEYIVQEINQAEMVMIAGKLVLGV